MSLSVQAVTALRSHWALEAVGVDDVQRAHDLVNELMAQQAVGRQIEFSFATQHTDCDLLDRVALGYEMAAIEGLDALSSASGNSALAEQATAAAHCAYDFRKLKVVPRANDERLFHVLQFSALAYCGERWSDLRRWYKENGSSLAAPSTADARWDHRLLYRIFDCWVRLFRKEGWDDLDRIREIIAGLREDQKIYEQAHLNAGPEAADRAMAFRLIALYHWAKATEILAQYMLQGDPPGVLSQVDKHFEASIRAATAAADAKHEMVLRWLHAAGRIMVTSSLWWGRGR